MSSRPDPGNTPQTLCVQYVGVTAFDGSTPSEPFNRPLISPTPDNILEIDQGGELGLIDPDGGSGGSQGDRFIQWMEVVLDSAADLTVNVVDGENPELVLTNPVPVQAVTTVFYRGTQFRVPQGGLIQVVTDPPVGGRIRFRPTIEPECCAEDGTSGGGSSSSAPYGSIGFGGTTPATQTGSATDFVDVVGPGVLDPAVGFTSSADNALTYQGVPATFFVEAQLNPNNGNIEEGPYQIRLTVNDVAVDSSLVILVIGETHRNMACTRAQLSLQSGDVVRCQIAAPPGGVDTNITYFRLDAHRV